MRRRRSTKLVRAPKSLPEVRFFGWVSDAAGIAGRAGPTAKCHSGNVTLEFVGEDTTTGNHYLRSWLGPSVPDGVIQPFNVETFPLRYRQRVRCVRQRNGVWFAYGDFGRSDGYYYSVNELIHALPCFKLEFGALDGWGDVAFNVTGAETAAQGYASSADEIEATSDGFEFGDAFPTGLDFLAALTGSFPGGRIRLSLAGNGIDEQVDFYPRADGAPITFNVSRPVKLNPSAGSVLKLTGQTLDGSASEKVTAPALLLVPLT